jgi:hypothetical protein
MEINSVKESGSENKENEVAAPPEQETLPEVAHPSPFDVVKQDPLETRTERMAEPEADHEPTPEPEPEPQLEPKPVTPAPETIAAEEAAPADSTSTALQHEQHAELEKVDGGAHEQEVY